MKNNRPETVAQLKIQRVVVHKTDQHYKHKKCDYKMLKISSENVTQQKKIVPKSTLKNKISFKNFDLVIVNCNCVQ